MTKPCDHSSSFHETLVLYMKVRRAFIFVIRPAAHDRQHGVIEGGLVKQRATGDHENHHPRTFAVFREELNSEFAAEDPVMDAHLTDDATKENCK